MVMEGGLCTVNVAALLVTEPAGLLTITSNVQPLSTLVVAGVVYVAAVAPGRFDPFFCH